MKMQVYRRELIIDKMVVDPLRASCTIPGVSASEVANYFFDKETRLQWDGTVESVDVVETLAVDTVVFHQLHKRVWPATQRETLFCSHMCVLTDAPRPTDMVGDSVMVFNFSIDHDKVPVSQNIQECRYIYIYILMRYLKDLIGLKAQSMDSVLIVMLDFMNHGRDSSSIAFQYLFLEAVAFFLFLFSFFVCNYKIVYNLITVTGP